jgi:hypothetical protein
MRKFSLQRVQFFGGGSAGAVAFCRHTTIRAMTGIRALPGEMRTERRNIDLVIGPGLQHVIVAGKRMATSLAGGRFMVAKLIGNIRQNAVVGFTPGLGSTEPRVDAFLFLICRWWLGRSPRIFCRPLEPKHHLD